MVEKQGIAKERKRNEMGKALVLLAGQRASLWHYLMRP